MVFSTHLSLLLYSVHSLMLIGQEILLIAGPLQVIASSLVLLLISWRSKKQTFVAHFSTEAEYRALADTTFELL